MKSTIINQRIIALLVAATLVGAVAQEKKPLSAEDAQPDG